VIVDAARPRADEPIARGRPGEAAMIEIVIGAATVTQNRRRKLSL